MGLAAVGARSFAVVAVKLSQAPIVRSKKASWTKGIRETKARESLRTNLKTAKCLFMGFRLAPIGLYASSFISMSVAVDALVDADAALP